MIVPNLNPIVIVLISLTVFLSLTWAVSLAISVVRSPISRLQYQNLAQTVMNVMRLQRLALSEHTRGASYFYAHVGCGHPVVWRDERVLDYFRQMREEGVEIRLIVGRQGASGQPHDHNWAGELQRELEARGITGCLIQERELPNHSIVAGGSGNACLYLCSHEEEDKFPTRYVTITDMAVAKGWKEYLGKQFGVGQT
jgi:hypothetical protein